MIEQALAPAIVIDSEWMLLHAFGTVDQFLKIPTGYGVNLHILQLIREELSLPLSTGIHRAINNSQKVSYKDLKLENDDGTEQYVSVEISLFWDQKAENTFVLILFRPQEEHGETQTETQLFYSPYEVNSHIAHLENQLQFTRESLQATIEELETSNEELQATNEELLASNEELQSTNEELQSVNEELLTVNNEYQAKIAELSALNDDISNLLKSTDIGTIFLDEHLNVRKFTPAVQNAVYLIEQDIGRPIQHIAHQLQNVPLMKWIRNVLDSLIPFSAEVENASGVWYLMRIFPYRTHNNQISGVILTFTDITELKKAMEKLEESQTFSDTVFNSLLAHIAVLDEKGMIIQVNEAWEKFSRENNGQSDNTGIGINYLQVCQNGIEADVPGSLESYQNIKALLKKDITSFELEYPCHSPTEQRWFWMRGIRIDNDPVRIVISHVDITQQELTLRAYEGYRERLAKLASHTSHVTFEMNHLAQYVWIQPSMLCYPPEDAIGKTDLEMLGESALGECIYQMQSTKKIIERQVSFTYEGEQLDYQVLLIPQIDDQQKLKSVVGIYYQIKGKS